MLIFSILWIVYGSAAFIIRITDVYGKKETYMKNGLITKRKDNLPTKKEVFILLLKCLALGPLERVLLFYRKLKKGQDSYFF